MKQAAAILGKTTELDRMNIFEFDHGAGVGRLVAEWARTGVPLVSSLDPGPFRYEDYREVWDVVMRGEVYSSPTTQKSGAIRELNELVATKSDLFVPVMVDGRFWGMLNFDDCTHERTWSAGEVEVLHAAAQAFAAAVARDRLERERAAAAARRVEELSKVNRSIQLGLDQLATLADPSGFVNTFLLTAADVFGADAAGVFLRQGDGTAMRPIAVVEDGTLLVADALAADPFLGTYEYVSAKDPAGIISDILASPHSETVFDDRLGDIWPAAHQWHAARGHRISWQFPMRVNGQSIGFFAFALRSPESPSTTQIEAVAALTQQFTLALELLRLSEQAKLAALAAERAREAFRHSAELQNANDALNRAVQGLVNLSDLDGFLEALLRESLAIAGAHTGAFALIDGDAIDHCVLFDRNGLVPRERSLRDGTARIPRTPELRRMEAEMLRSAEYWAVDPRGDVNPPSFMEFHARQGNLAVRCVPMRVGERLIGWLGLGFPTTDPPAAQRLTLLRVLAEHATVAVEVSRLATEAREAAVARERAARQQAVLEERTRIAREIHDTLAQGLVGILMSVREASACLPDRTAGAIDRLGVAERLAGESLDAARRSVRTLRPSADSAATLPEAVRRLCDVAASRSRLNLSFVGPDGPLDVPGEVADEFHRIGQEAIHNAVRHAAASAVTVTLDCLDTGGVRLSVKDDGRGFDPDYPVPGHFGIAGMQERAARVGATVTIISEIGRGTEIVAAWAPRNATRPSPGGQ